MLLDAVHDYSLNRGAALTRYIDDADARRQPLVENQIRPIAWHSTTG